MKLCPKNWREFQHYKDRAPPWIRLQRKLLDDKDFHRLPVASRALAPMLWLLASESIDGQFDGDPDELAFRLRSTEKEMAAALKPLIDKGFFILVQKASTVLAGCFQGAVPEAETEALQSQRAPTVLVERDALDAKPEPYEVPDCPYEAILAAYAARLPSLPQLTVVNEVRRGHMRGRWREVCSTEKFTPGQGIEFFDWYFGHVSKSSFLTGNGRPNKDGRVWKADFDWLLLPTNFAKVVEGRYNGKAAA